MCREDNAFLILISRLYEKGERWTAKSLQVLRGAYRSCNGFTCQFIVIVDELVIR